MAPQLILYIILGISVVSFVFDQALEYLNLKAQRPEIPDEIAAFYDREKYLKSLAYQRDQTRFSFLSVGVSFALSISMLAFGGFGWLDRLLRPYFSNEILLALVFFGVLALVADIFAIPFQWYDTFVIEHRYGFNKSTPRLFVLDKMKGYALGAVVGGALLSLLLYLVERIGPGFWIWFGVAAAALILLINVFYTSLILPLFNRLTPLPEGTLRQAIEDFARKLKFPLENIFVMDGSKRSTKANAFFSGMGKRKKIVLYDTLVERYTAGELVAVLAHEVGHFKKRHIVVAYFLAVVQVFLTLFILSRMVFNTHLSLALGGGQLAFHLNLLAFAILFSPVSAVTGLLMSAYSRRNEFEADAYASQTSSGTALATALKRLSVDSLSNLYPHPLYVFFHYSHPPLLRRVAALQSQTK
jgi:STE24 endopeptidase